MPFAMLFRHALAFCGLASARPPLSAKLLYQDHPQGWLRVTNPDEEVMIHTNQPSYSWLGRAEPTENKLYIL